MSEWSPPTLAILQAARRGEFLAAFQGLEQVRGELPRWEAVEAELVVSALSGYFPGALAAIEAGNTELADDPQHMVVHCLNSAWALLRYGDVCRAEDMVLIGLALVERHRSNREIAHWEGRLLLNWGEVAYALSEYDQAYKRYLAGEMAIMACGHPFELETRSCTLPVARAGAGMSLYRLGQADRARDVLCNLDGFVPESAAVGLVARAAVALLDGRSAEAFALVQQVKHMAMEDRIVLVEAQRLETEALQRLGRRLERDRVLAEAVRLGATEGLDHAAKLLV